jgi:hypothetical protein
MRALNKTGPDWRVRAFLPMQAKARCGISQIAVLGWKAAFQD